MWTLGIDIAKFKHNATLLDEDGNKVFANFSFTNDQAGLTQLLDKITAAGQAPDQVVVGMEATGHYWILLFEHLVKEGFEVKLINPLVTRARRNITIRGSKTDALDSLLIARLLRDEALKVSAVPDAEISRLRTLTRLRYECAQEATALKLRLIALLDVVFPEYQEHFTDIFGAASREILSQFPTAAELAQVDVRRLTKLMNHASHGRKGRRDAQMLQQAAQNSFARDCTNRNLALEIRIIVERLNLTLEHIKELEREMQNYFVDLQNLLKSIPGIAEVWAPTILAEALPVFDPNRRDGGTAFVAIAGIDPRLRKSGKYAGKAKMSKRGSKYLRTAVIQAAGVAANISHDPLFKSIYDKHISKGKSHLEALSHVANQMLHVIFSVLKNKKPYVPIINHNVINIC